MTDETIEKRNDPIHVEDVRMLKEDVVELRYEPTGEFSHEERKGAVVRVKFRGKKRQLVVTRSRGIQFERELRERENEAVAA